MESDHYIYNTGKEWVVGKTLQHVSIIMTNQNCSKTICPDVSQCQDPWKVTYNGEVVPMNEMKIDKHIILSCTAGFGCPEETFTCNNKKCISESLKCDGKNDCGDNTDEVEGCCDFTCKNHKCIHHNAICNGIDDCGDFSDEENCKDIQGCCMCLKNQFLCHNKKCIPENWRCNGIDDCGDQSDEISHECRDYACGEDEFSCFNHKCVPVSLKCNGKNDCGDNSDETKDCAVRRRCPEDYPFAFKWGGYCCETPIEDKSSIHLEGCDGSELSMNSICCEQNNFLECPFDEGCTNNKDKANIDMLLACGNDGNVMIITPSNNTDVHSPGYPDNYPNSLNCKWHIKADGGNRIELIIKGHELEENGDFMYVYDGNTTDPNLLINTETGVILPSDIQSSASDMMIVFTSDFSLGKIVEQY